jgi:hypothetical protein
MPYLKADLNCPIFPEIRELLIKTVGFVDVLKDALEPVRSGIHVAFVYGLGRRCATRRRVETRPKREPHSLHGGRVCKKVEGPRQFFEECESWEEVVHDRE